MLGLLPELEAEPRLIQGLGLGNAQLVCAAAPDTAATTGSLRRRFCLYFTTQSMTNCT